MNITMVDELTDDVAAPAPPRPRRRVPESARVLVPLAVAIVSISLYTNHENANFLTASNLENIGVQTAVLAIIALGQTYLIIAGQLDLSVGSLASLSSVIAATMLADGASEPAALAVCVLVGAAVGLVWGLVVTYLRVPPFILTLGGLSILSSIALQRAGDRPVPASDGFGWLRTGEILGLRWPIALSLVLLAVSVFVLGWTRFGRHVYALGSSEEAAFLAGLPVRRTKVSVYVISSALTALAGVVLLARLGAGDPRGGVGLELRAIAAVVLGGATLAGGRGSPLGTALGVLLLGVVATALTFLDVDASYEGLVFGGVLAVAVIVTAVGELIRRARA